VTLRRIVKDQTGQDVQKCQGCQDCDLDIPEELDIPLASLIQLVLLDDEEALESRTLWSDAVLDASRGACKRGLQLNAIILALRHESSRRLAGTADHLGG
jgi:hypothetical protein